jgi:hypothetical protein
VLLALQRLGQPTTIERLIPLHELVRTFAGDQRRGDEWPLPVPAFSQVSHPGRPSRLMGDEGVCGRSHGSDR